MVEAEGAATRLKVAETKLAELRVQVAGATRLEDSQRMLESARAEEKLEADRWPEMELAAAAADERAAAVARDLEEHLEALGAQRAASQQAEMERARWRDRIDDLRRQIQSVDDDLTRLGQAANERENRVAEVEGLARASLERLPAWNYAYAAPTVSRAECEAESPQE